MKKQVWIGLAHVKPRRGNNLLKDAAGAYVNILAMANNKQEYIKIIKYAIEEHNFKMIDVKNIEPYLIRKKKFKLKREIVQLANKVKKSGITHFATFFVYDSKEQ